ncbi:hypothetical protein N656DRAFT_406438 [Canariomyces notabilis]|uniref:Uncharacterized protein n=1 Tax=Canariomyces notabilis TaxID=2074819 RepID=A0AAN6TK31_9PEZI|nr:hypothetical protein N656DRAFT_406438 [Canariomyces arenarius]
MLFPTLTCLRFVCLRQARVGGYGFASHSIILYCTIQYLLDHLLIPRKHHNFIWQFFPSRRPGSRYALVLSLARAASQALTGELAIACLIPGTLEWDPPAENIRAGRKAWFYGCRSTGTDGWRGGRGGFEARRLELETTSDSRYRICVPSVPLLSLAVLLETVPTVDS